MTAIKNKLDNTYSVYFKQAVGSILPAKKQKTKTKTEIHYPPISVLFITVTGLLTSDVKFMQIIPLKAIKPVQ